MKMVGEGCGWLAFEDEDGGRGKMKMVGEGCGWLTFEDEDGLISLQM
jgi:hypothetical protein